MAEPPQTDVSRPSALPTAKLLQRPTFNQALVDQNSDEYLDAIEEDWNKKLDVEVEVLVDGMVDIVSLASVSVACIFSSYTSNSVRSVTRTSFESHKNRSRLSLVRSLWYEKTRRLTAATYRRKNPGPCS
jgi:mediator of RNA polymerase II transcription subunit 22